MLNLNVLALSQIVTIQLFPPSSLNEFEHKPFFDQVKRELTPTMLQAHRLSQHKQWEISVWWAKTINVHLFCSILII